jgi:hypothetical protein
MVGQELDRHHKDRLTSRSCQLRHEVREIWFIHAPG